jgi:hypothetical protein
VRTIDEVMVDGLCRFADECHCDRISAALVNDLPGRGESTCPLRGSLVFTTATFLVSRLCDGVQHGHRFGSIISSPLFNAPTRFPCRAAHGGQIEAANPLGAFDKQRFAQGVAASSDVETMFRSVQTDTPCARS